MPGRIRTIKQGGFTLIEIIIVVVIMGILAAVALPKLTDNIDRVRAAEAFLIGGAAAHGFSNCVAQIALGRTATNADVKACNSFAKIDMFDPNPYSPSFIYTFTIPGNGTKLHLEAVGKFSTANAVSDIVTFDYDAITGQVTKDCSGKFTNMCRD